MASIVQWSTATVSGGSSGSVVSAALPSLPTAGNAIICLVAEARNYSGSFASSIVDSAGNHLSSLEQYTSNSAGNGQELWWLPSVGATSGTYTVTMSSTGTQDVTIQLVEVSGLSTSGYDQIGTGVSAAGGPFTLTAGGYNSSGTDIVLAMFADTSYNPSAVVSNPPSGWSNLTFLPPNGSSNYRVYNFVSRVCTSIEQSSATWSWTNGSGDTPNGIIASFKPAGGGSASGSGAITESSDVAAGSLAVAASVSAAITERADIAAASASTTTSVSAGILESHDVSAGTVSNSTAVSAAITESFDIAAGTTSNTASATAAILESGDIAGASAGTTTSLSATILELPDQPAVATAFSTSVSAAVIEQSDAAAASVYTGNGAVASIGESHDVVAAAASVSTSVYAAILESSDQSVSAAGASLSASAAIVESHDIAVAVYTPPNTATVVGAITELSDFAAGSASSSTSVAATITESHDSAAGLATPPAVITGSIFESSDIVVATGFAGILTPTPGYEVSWQAGQNPQFFPAKTPAESLVLAFNFAAALPAGVTLSGTPTVTFTVLAGTDSSPTALANGYAQLDPTDTLVYVPVTAGLEGVAYAVDVVIATTESELVLDLSGALLVTAWSDPNWPDAQAQPVYVLTPNYLVRWTAGRDPKFFPSKPPGASVVLTFDFSAGLPTGVTLSGTPSVGYSVVAGADPDPSALSNGSPYFDSSSTKVYVPVAEGLESVGYLIDVSVSTTLGNLILDLAGGLWVSAWGNGNWPYA